MARRRRRSARSLVLEVLLLIVAFFVLVNVVFPWAGRTLTEGFQQTNERLRSPAPSPSSI